MIQTFGEFQAAAESVAGEEADHDEWLHAAFSKLADIYRQLNELAKELSRNEVQNFEDELRDYSRQIAAAKVMLADRGQALLAYQNATKLVEQRKNKKQDEREASAKMEEARNHFTRINEGCAVELEQFDEQRARDLRAILNALVQLNVNYELRVVDLWKAAFQDMQELALL